MRPRNALHGAPVSRPSAVFCMRERPATSSLMPFYDDLIGKLTECLKTDVRLYQTIKISIDLGHDSQLECRERRCTAMPDFFDKQNRQILQ